MRQRIILVGFFFLISGAELSAETTSTRLTTETIDKQPFAFSIEVTDRFHEGRELRFRVAVRLKKGERLSPKFQFTGGLKVRDRKALIASCAVSSTEKDGRIVYTFLVSERFLKDSTFVFGESLVAGQESDGGGRYYWFYLKDFAKPKPEVVGRPSPSAAEAFPLAGRWLLTMPRGFEYDATLEPAGEVGLYRLRCGALNLQGLYEMRRKCLTLVKPDNLHLAGLAWEIRNNNALLLTEQPNQAQVGSDYRGATLGRQKQAGRTQR